MSGSIAAARRSSRAWMPTTSCTARGFGSSSPRSRALRTWRDRPVRLSRTADRYGLDRFTACKAAFLAAHFLAATEAYVLWGYGPTGRALRRALLAEGKQPSHIVELHPGRIGNTIHGA